MNGNIINFETILKNYNEDLFIKLKNEITECNQVAANIAYKIEKEILSRLDMNDESVKKEMNLLKYRIFTFSQYLSVVTNNIEKGELHVDYYMLVALDVFRKYCENESMKYFKTNLKISMLFDTLTETVRYTLYNFSVLLSDYELKHNLSILDAVSFYEHDYQEMLFVTAMEKVAGCRFDGFFKKEAFKYWELTLCINAGFEFISAKEFPSVA